MNLAPGQASHRDAVKVRHATEEDFAALLRLAAQVENWFGPMVEEAGFHEALRKHIGRSTALVAVSSSEVIGGLLFRTVAHRYHIEWLVVSESSRGQGVGRALIDRAVRRWVDSPGDLEVVTFGIDHPGAVASGSRVFYERLGFKPAEACAPGPEGGARQVFRRSVLPSSSFLEERLS